MKKFARSLSPRLIIDQLDKKYLLINNKELDNVAELKEANSHSVCFYQDNKFFDALQNSEAGLIFVPLDFDPTQKQNTNLIFVEKPYIYFMEFVKKWLSLDQTDLEHKISKSAQIAETAEIDKNVTIGANCVLGANVKIASGVKIGANCVIQENTIIGEKTILYPNCTIYNDSQIGENVIIHSGSVIGADGFGYLFHENQHHKIPQVGNVVIHNNVEIGANTTIDRSTLGSTVIGEGTKIDNLVQIGHNCKIGRNTIICAQTGLAGSTEIGDNVYLAGQVGVAGHLKIDDNALIGAQSGVMTYVPKKKKFFGTPAKEAGEMKRILISEKHLPELVRDLRKRQKKDGS